MLYQSECKIIRQQINEENYSSVFKKYIYFV